MAMQHWWTTHRYGVLTALQALYILSLGLVGMIPAGIGRFALSELVSLLLFGIANVVAMFAVTEKRSMRFTIAVLFGLFVLFYAVDRHLANPAIAAAQHVVGLVFLGFVIVYATLFFFRTRQVTSNTLFSAVSTYLMMAIWWAVAYTLIAYADPVAFNLPDGEPASFSIFMGHDEYAATPMYYSLVTLTTLGYGDITPASGPARMLSAMQALIGQLFIAIVVARLVGLHLAHSMHLD